MSLQSAAVVVPCTDPCTRNTQWHRLSRPYPVGLQWSRRRFVVTNAAPGRQEPRKEVFLDKHDLMALEFGRLLGESKEKTLSKIVGKKIVPNASYIEIEKQAKSGKGRINKAGFAVQVDNTREKASNGTQELPRLVSPPLRAGVLSVSAPPASKLGGRRAGWKVESEESLDDSVLRKPSSRQRPTSGGASAVEEGANGGLEMLRKPLTTKLSSVSLGRESMERDESMEASKAEFQHLLDQSFGSSKASSIRPNLASPLSRQAKSQDLSSSASCEMTKSESRNQLDDAGLAAVEDELNDLGRTCTESSGAKHQESSDMVPVLPHLASPPLRNKGPISTFVQPAGGRTKAPQPPLPSSSSSHSIKSLGNKDPDELLLSKPRSPATKNAALPPMQQPDSDKSLESTEGVLQCQQPDSDESTGGVLQNEQDSHPALRLFASRPFRPKPSFGTFVEPARAKMRPSQSTGIDEALVETHLRRPSLSETRKDSTATTGSAELNAEPPSYSTQVVLEREISDDVLDDLNSAKGLEESSGPSLGNGVQSPCEECPQSKSLIALGGAIEAGSQSCDVSLSGGPHHEGQTSEKKSVKVAALKKPVQGPSMSSSVEESSNNGYLGLKTDTGMEPEVENSRLEKEAESIEPLKPTSMATALSVQPLEENEDREASPDDSSAEQPKKVLRRPSPTAELLGRPSPHIDVLHQAKEEEVKEWARAEALWESKEVVEVKLIGSNSAGLFVSFGCLVGFLPSFELSPKRGLMDFTSWAQQRGHDLAKMRTVSLADSGHSGLVTLNGTMTGGELNELKEKYKDEVSKLMSSLVGERTRVLVKGLDKSLRKLKLSEKEADPDCQEHAQRKAKLMAELQIGNIVACEVKSITPIGVFVEVDGVSALIHRSEVSWNPKADPASLLSIGEVIKAKVCRLDRTLQRINLSLKQMQTDPLKLTLESVVGDSDTDIAVMPEMDTVEAKVEVIWPELEDLIAKLQKMDDISCVARGRCLYSAAFAPTFQVLISNPQSNGYKLLARYGNKIQEVLVDTTLDRNRMKECIRLCTFTVAA